MSKKKTEKRLQEIYDEIIETSPKTVREFEEKDFNTYIIVGFLPNAPINMMVGRIVQIRMEAGAFGSNQIFFRQYDNKLMIHENQWFYRVPEKYISELNDIFKDAYLDEPNLTYSLRHEDPENGFVVKSKVKEGETTPMREVKKDIKEALFGK